MSAPLAWRIALVAGATRESGRATARELGAAGTTVLRTARGTAGALGCRPSTYRDLALTVDKRMLFGQAGSETPHFPHFSATATDHGSRMATRRRALRAITTRRTHVA